MGLQGSDLALLTARFGAGRFGASRFGFIPCPEDVEGVGNDEPGEYIWREVKPPTTEWTIVGEDCVCRNLCTLALSVITLDDATPVEDQDITASVTLSGVLGLVDGIARINWGDGKHDESQEMPLEDGVIQFTNHYHAVGDYTITVTVWDERGCEVSETLAVTVGAGFSVTVVAEPQIDSPSGQAEVLFFYTVVGGVAPYTYLLTWTGGGDAGPNTDLDPQIFFTGAGGTPETIPFHLVVTDDTAAEAEFDGTVDVTYTA